MGPVLHCFVSGSSTSVKGVSCIKDAIYISMIMYKLSFSSSRFFLKFELGLGRLIEMVPKASPDIL